MPENKATVIIMCILCGEKRTLHIDHEKDDDVALIGLHVSGLLKDGHTIVVGQFNTATHRSDLN